MSYLVRKSASFGEMNVSVSAKKLNAALTAAASHSDTSPAKEQRSFTIMDHFDLHFLSSLNGEDKLFLCGQGSSHCSGFSMLDILQHCRELSSTAETQSDSTGGEETQKKPMNTSMVSILRDGISINLDQLQSCASYILEEDCSSFSSVEDFWKAIEKSGARTRSVQDKITA